ncbi:hypothetical protein QLX08_005028 [Tetragonisca angustula]|uniref:Uncharacterized protein n=1 Tax=Tetragonisca angustula TaxID=166442 RepID=A0AAW1A2R6_9HYME
MSGAGHAGKKKRKLWRHITIDFLKPSAKETGEGGNAERGGRQAEKPKRGVKQEYMPSIKDRDPTLL